MGDYTKLSKDEAKNILRLYGIGELTEISPLALGISNSNYRIKTKDMTYLLKVSNDKDSSQLQEEQKIMLEMHQNQFKYSLKPLLTLEKSTVYHWNSHCGVLFPFVKGIPPGPNDNTCFQIGEGLAQLHDIKINRQGLRQHREVGYEWEDILDYVLSKNCPEQFSGHYDTLLKPWSEFYSSWESANSLLHGDLYYDNVLFDNNKLAWILDFEQAGLGPSWLDIGISISGTCLEKGQINGQLVRRFIEGYQSCRELSPQFHQHIGPIIILGLTSISLWRIKRFKEGVLNPMLEESYRELLIRAKLLKLRYPEFF